MAQTAVESMSMTDRLARHPIFAGMNRSQLAILADCARAVQFQEGRVIFREGDVADRFYLIETGKVNLESSCGLAAPMLGWSWMFPPNVRTCTARAIELTTAVFFDAAILLEYCEQNPSFGYEFLKRLNFVLYQWMREKRNSRLAIHPRDPVRQHAAYGRACSVGPEWSKVA
jgi:CRP-like cAMP-binding protein